MFRAVNAATIGASPALHPQEETAKKTSHSLEKSLLPSALASRLLV
jgi:hypothetical protein